MKSVLLPFYKGLELERFPKKVRIQILTLVTEYLLGCCRFSSVKSQLSKYNCQSEFQHVLRELTKDYQMIYRRPLRSYVKGREVRISNFDKKYLEKMNLSSFIPKIKRTSFPTEEEVMKSMSYTVNSTAYKFQTNRQLIRMTHIGIEDIKQLMYCRILATYRVYLPSLGNILPKKAFYAVLHRALSSSLIDKIREFNTRKSQLLINYASLGEDFEASTDAVLYSMEQFSPSPEEVLQAKEAFFKLDFDVRVQLNA